MRGFLIILFILFSPLLIGGSFFSSHNFNRIYLKYISTSKEEKHQNPVFKNDDDLKREKRKIHPGFKEPHPAILKILKNSCFDTHPSNSIVREIVAKKKNRIIMNV